MAKIEKGIGQLSTVTESLVSLFADLAIEESDSYKEAIELVHENASLTVQGQAMKKAIQDKITERALNSEVKKEMLSPTRTSYIHFAFADSLDGRINFSTFIPGDRRYIGFYRDFKKEGSVNPNDYIWHPIEIRGPFSSIR